MSIYLGSIWSTARKVAPQHGTIVITDTTQDGIPNGIPKISVVKPTEKIEIDNEGFVDDEKMSSHRHEHSS